MYIDYVPNKKLYRAIYLRESHREGKKVIKKTISNISNWEPKKISALQLVLNGETRIGTETFKIIRSLPHGSVTAVLGTMKRLELPVLLTQKPSVKRNLILSLIANRLLSPRSKLATARGLDPQTATNTLYQELSLTRVSVYDLYSALDCLLKRKPMIEKKLAQKHLSGNALVLYDLTSVYFEGKTCPLTFLGHSKDKKGSLQILVGLLTNKEGIPISTEVFEGNTLDHQTLVSQIDKVRNKYGIKDIIIVGDRGTIITKRIEEDMRGIEGLSFVTALGAKQVAGLMP